MKYLCLVYVEEEKVNALPEGEFASFQSECWAFKERQRERGTFVDGAPLQPVRTATTVRVRNGMMSITDGPFAETKEQLGGYLLIDARDLNDAIRVAASFPTVRYGSVEVRPLRELVPFRGD
jgi:hypothetical protein